MYWQLWLTTPILVFPKNCTTWTILIGDSSQHHETNCLLIHLFDFIHSANLPSLFETLRSRPVFFLGGWLLWASRAKLQVGVLQLQGPQEFDEWPIDCPILSHPSHDNDGQRAALQPRQNHTCLGNGIIIYFLHILFYSFHIFWNDCIITVQGSGTTSFRLQVLVSVLNVFNEFTANQM